MNIDDARTMAIDLGEWFIKGPKLRGECPLVHTLPTVPHASRQVIIAKESGWVFKYGPDNYDEIAVYERNKDSDLFTTGPYRLPLTFMANEIIVQEFIDGTHPEPYWWEDTHQYALEHEMGCMDLHNENVVYDGTHYWIIDLGWDEA